MKPENKAFLDEQRHHHETLVKAFYLRSLSGHIRSEMERVMREEFRHGYTADLWCPSCVSTMVLDLYHHYDEWLANNPVIVEPEPIIIKANFPKHKKK